MSPATGVEVGPSFVLSGKFTTYSLKVPMKDVVISPLLKGVTGKVSLISRIRMGLPIFRTEFPVQVIIDTAKNYQGFHQCFKFMCDSSSAHILKSLDAKKGLNTMFSFIKSNVGAVKYYCAEAVILFAIFNVMNALSIASYSMLDSFGTALGIAFGMTLPEFIKIHSYNSTSKFIHSLFTAQELGVSLEKDAVKNYKLK